MSDEEEEEGEWRPVAGSEGEYEVSSQGRVRSLPMVTLRADGKPLPVRGRILKTSTDSKGHPNPEAHGNYSTYLNWYCRCDACREAFNEYQREYRGKRANIDA